MINALSVIDEQKHTRRDPKGVKVL